jgi:hypothetical protein
MTMKLYAVLGATLAMTLISTSALADCPYVFEGESCAGDTGSANCTRVADDEVECDFTPASQGVDAYFVSPTDTSFRAYGFDGDGDEFCCEFGADKVDGGDGDGDLVFGGADTELLNAGGPDPADNCENDHRDSSCENWTMTSCPW